MKSVDTEIKLIYYASVDHFKLVFPNTNYGTKQFPEEFFKFLLLSF